MKRRCVQRLGIAGNRRKSRALEESIERRRNGSSEKVAPKERNRAPSFSPTPAPRAIHSAGYLRGDVSRARIRQKKVEHAPPADCLVFIPAPRKKRAHPC